MSRFILAVTLLMAGAPSWAQPAVGTSVTTPNAENDCTYRVQPGEDLGTILVRLGVGLVWGPNGAIHRVLERNRTLAQKNGDFVRPNTLIHIPKQLLGGSGQCSAVAVEKDERKRLELYTLAEKKIHTGQYERVCHAFEELAEMPTQTRDHDYILHFAAVCEYENRNWVAAHRLWTTVLRQTRDGSLKLRATYNLALIECQRNRAVQGYERLGHLDPEVLFHEAEFEQRSFVFLVEYCADKAGGNDARLAALHWLQENAGSPGIRDFARSREGATAPQQAERLVASKEPEPEPTAAAEPNTSSQSSAFRVNSATPCFRDAED